MIVEIEQDHKRLIFDSTLKGLKVGDKEYLSGKDGVLIYDQVEGVKADNVELQLSTNTSTLIPAFRVLGLRYYPYFDEKPVVESQNNITFYWNPSKLAAFYNRYSTDGLEFTEREPVIKRAVEFLSKNVENLPLEDEYLARAMQPCKLLGFYQGFPIFDSSTGFARLQSRLGIHIDPEEITISTPLDKYEEDVYGLAEEISRKTGLDYSKKKNRVIFPKVPNLLKLIGLEGHP